MRSCLGRALASVAAVFAFVAVPAVAGAHEVREVGDGRFRIVIGFLEEPAFAGEKNGLDLRVTLDEPGTPAADGTVTRTPVERLDQTLQAEVIYGDQTMALPLAPAFQNPGAYQSYFFPMAPGDYTFHVFGTIDGVQIDEFFTSSPEGFNPVEPVEPYQFPKPTASGDTGEIAGASTTGEGDLDLGFGLEALVVLTALAGLLGYRLRRIGGLPRRLGLRVRP